MDKSSETEPGYLYGGLTGATMPTHSYTLGEGIQLRETYAHLFSANLMAFEKPGPVSFPDPDTGQK